VFVCAFFYSPIVSSFPAHETSTATYTHHRQRLRRTRTCHDNQTVFGGPPPPRRSSHRPERTDLRTRGRRHHEVHTFRMDNSGRGRVRALLLRDLHIVASAILPRRSEYHRTTAPKHYMHLYIRFITSK